MWLGGVENKQEKREEERMQERGSCSGPEARQLPARHGDSREV